MGSHPCQGEMRERSPPELPDSVGFLGRLAIAPYPGDAHRMRGGVSYQLTEGQAIRELPGADPTPPLHHHVPDVAHHGRPPVGREAKPHACLTEVAVGDRCGRLGQPPRSSHVLPSHPLIHSKTFSKGTPRGAPSCQTCCSQPWRFLLRLL